MHANVGAFVILSTLLSACTTTLTSVPVTQGSKVARGVVYTLPKQAFDIEGRFLVTGCTRNGTTTDLKYRLSGASITPKLVPDAGETYAFRYEDLASATKITTAKVLWHPNGMLKSLNTEVDDRSAEIVASVAKTALNLYTASVVPFAGLSIGAAGTACGPFIDDLLKEKDALETTKIQAARRADEALIKARKVLSDARVKLLVSKEQLEVAKKIDDKSEVARLTGVVRGLEAQEKVAQTAVGADELQVPTLEDKLAAITKLLTATVNLVGWDVLEISVKTTQGDKTEYCTDVQAPQQSYWSDLVRKSSSPINHKPLAAHSFLANACVLVSNRAGPEPTPLDGAGKTSHTVETAAVGLYYRQPNVGNVYVKDGNDPDRRFYAGSLISLPQFGTKAVISLKNQAFDKNAVKVIFNEDGSLSEFSFEQQAQAERLAASAENLSGTIVELMKLRAEAAAAKAKSQDDAARAEQQKQLDALDSQIALAEKRTKLETVRAPAKDDLDREKELLNKQIAVEELRQRYAELLKKGTPQ